MVDVPGVRLKFREFEDPDGITWITAVVWVYQAPQFEIGRLRASGNLNDMNPGNPLYQAWVDSMAAFFQYHNQKVLGEIVDEDLVKVKRRKPDYRGE